MTVLTDAQYRWEIASALGSLPAEDDKLGRAVALAFYLATDDEPSEDAVRGLENEIRMAPIDRRAA